MDIETHLNLLRGAGDANTVLVLKQQWQTRAFKGPFMTSRPRGNIHLPGTDQQVDQILVSAHPDKEQACLEATEMAKAKKLPNSSSAGSWQPFGCCWCGLGATLTIVGAEKEPIKIEATRVNFHFYEKAIGYQDLPYITAVTAWASTDLMTPAEIAEFDYTAIAVRSTRKTNPEKPETVPTLEAHIRKL